MADRFPLIVNPGANQIQEIPGTDNIVIPGQIKLTTTAASGSNGDSTIRISGDTSNVSRLLIEGKGSNTAGSFTNIAEFKLTNTTPVVKTTGSFEGNGITPIGGIIMWGGLINDIPSGFTFCDGRLMSRTNFAALFTAIGTIHNRNDGTEDNTNFRLPNLRDRFVVGAQQDGLNNDPYPGVSPGVTGGSASSTGSHTHKYAYASREDHLTAGIMNNYQSSGISNVTDHGKISELEQTGNPAHPDMHGFTADTDDTGTNTGNMPPYIALAYIIRSI
tara:strand:- start:1 stop:825 length:825 start_codon:yes stop_codon:yes gene_type:complete